MLTVCSRHLSSRTLNLRSKIHQALLCFSLLITHQWKTKSEMENSTKVMINKFYGKSLLSWKMKNIYILINLWKALRIYPVELFQNKNHATLFYWLLPWWQLSHLDFIKISEDLKSFGNVKTESFRLTLPNFQQ